MVYSKLKAESNTDKGHYIHAIAALISDCRTQFEGCKKLNLLFNPLRVKKLGGYQTQMQMQMQNARLKKKGNQNLDAQTVKKSKGIITLQRQIRGCAYAA